ncbi:hypothetical protein [Sphingomonas sp. PR090111-T3T-6A]|uniref:hypothetical protein n=1 Tax=Sphingomonas sp. PR090111-T3T-6A TaxID=685778 RepID=UPI000380270E|nr:hypothetical protein [Sphingomonas sp. PR090111-T3T-6A]
MHVKRTDDGAYITVKRPRAGIIHAEFEYEIPVNDAAECWLFSAALVEKTLFCIRHPDVVWEIDVFGGNADGIVIAEVELASDDQCVTPPEWIGREVSHDPRYCNPMSLRRPLSGVAQGFTIATRTLLR